MEGVSKKKARGSIKRGEHQGSAKKKKKLVTCRPRRDGEKGTSVQISAAVLGEKILNIKREEPIGAKTSSL